MVGILSEGKCRNKIAKNIGDCATLVFALVVSSLALDVSGYAVPFVQRSAAEVVLVPST